MRMSTNMGLTMDASRVTTSIVASAPIELKQKSLMDITTVPPKNIQPKQKQQLQKNEVNMMSQGNTLEPQTYKVKYLKMLFAPSGHSHQQSNKRKNNNNM